MNDYLVYKPSDTLYDAYISDLLVFQTEHQNGIIFGNYYAKQHVVSVHNTFLGIEIATVHKTYLYSDITFDHVRFVIGLMPPFEAEAYAAKLMAAKAMFP